MLYKNKNFNNILFKIKKFFIENYQFHNLIIYDKITFLNKSGNEENINCTIAIDINNYNNTQICINNYYYNNNVFKLKDLFISHEIFNQDLTKNKLILPFIKKGISNIVLKGKYYELYKEYREKFHEEKSFCIRTQIIHDFCDHLLMDLNNSFKEKISLKIIFFDIFLKILNYTYSFTKSILSNIFSTIKLGIVNMNNILIHHFYSLKKSINSFSYKKNVELAFDSEFYFINENDIHSFANNTTFTDYTNKILNVEINNNRIKIDGVDITEEKWVVVRKIQQDKNEYVMTNKKFNDKYHLVFKNPDCQKKSNSKITTKSVIDFFVKKYRCQKSISKNKYFDKF
ncbi:hypothetical protein [Lyticum sinuosum]|uniref:Uncharacterized protein n=1 Tax=Lyticum sinuosum TaxID=1332059 RepID=A0AAE4VLE4_9RICK|nr:hypothetical protein [Lyticum sinuosum]MDZ5761377.1 hypothetical protein [Lyticum sinuosum]